MPVSPHKRNIRPELDAMRPYLAGRTTNRGYGFSSSSSGGTPPTITNPQYLVLATHADLENERRFVDGDGLIGSDGGANGDYTLAVDLVDAWSGLEFSSGELRVDLGATFAWANTHAWGGTSEINLRDAALKIYSSTDGQLDIDADTEAELTAPTIELVAATRVHISAGPLDLNGTLEFQGAESITTTAGDLTIAPASNLLLDPTGQQVDLDGTLEFQGPESITTTTGDLTIAPAGDLLLDPAGQQIKFANWNAGDSLESSDYVSQTTGWAVSYGSSGGHADFRSIFADELHVLAFIADVYEAHVGAIIVTKSRARLSRDFTIPANTNTGTLYVEDLEGWGDTQLFSTNDIIRLRYVDTSGGGLIVTDVWGVATGYSDLTGGEQSYTFTTSDDGGVSGNKIYTGAIALDYGQSGSGSRGVWEATVLDAAGAPYSQVKTWATNPWTPGNWTARVRLGNLDGISGVGLEYGLWAGQNTTDTFLLLSDSNFEVHGIDIKLYDGGVPKVQLVHDEGLIVSSGSWGTNTTTFAAVFADDSTVTNLDAGDVIIGTPFHSIDDSKRGIWWDSSVATLYIKADATNFLKIVGSKLQFYSAGAKTIELSGVTGNATFGVVGANKFNLMWDASAGDLLLRQNIISYFQVDGSASLMKFGSDVSEPGTTAIAIFGVAQTYNAEALGAGDLLIGDNSTNIANILWDKSAGRLYFRSGKTVNNIYIDTTGQMVMEVNPSPGTKSLLFKDGTLTCGYIDPYYVVGGPNNVFRIGTQGIGGDCISLETEQVVISGVSNTTSLPVQDDELVVFGRIRLIDGIIHLSHYENTNMVMGITIDQEINDDEIFNLRSSDVGAVYAAVDTKTFGTMQKAEGGSGGLQIRGYHDAGGSYPAALWFQGFVAKNTDTTKSTGGRAIIEIVGYESDGSAVANTVANGNVLAVRTYRGASVTLLLVDEDGDLHLDAGAGVGGTIHGWVFDEYDDGALLHGLRASLTPAGHELRERFGEFIGYARPVLEEAGIVHYNDGPGEDGRPFIAMRGLSYLMIDAMRQLYQRCERYEQALLELGTNPGLLVGA